MTNCEGFSIRYGGPPSKSTSPCNYAIPYIVHSKLTLICKCITPHLHSHKIICKNMKLSSLVKSVSHS